MAKRASGDWTLEKVQAEKPAFIPAGKLEGKTPAGYKTCPECKGLVRGPQTKKCPQCDHVFQPKEKGTATRGRTARASGGEQSGSLRTLRAAYEFTRDVADGDTNKARAILDSVRRAGSVDELLSGVARLDEFASDIGKRNMKDAEPEIAAMFKLIG